MNNVMLHCDHDYTLWFSRLLKYYFKNKIVLETSKYNKITIKYKKELHSYTF